MQEGRGLVPYYPVVPAVAVASKTEHRILYGWYLTLESGTWHAVEGITQEEQKVLAKPKVIS